MSRQAQPPTRPQRRQASPKVLFGVAAAVAVVIAGALVVVAVGRGRSSPASSVPKRGSLAHALPGAADVARLLAGVPQRGNVLGPRHAPVTLVEYVDLQCPYCREFSTQALPELVARYVRAGKLRIEVRPIAFIGPDSQRGRAAVIAAAGQNRMFDFAELLYFNQGVENTGWLDERTVEATAASIPGLDVRRLLRDRSTAAVGDRAHTYDAQARSQNVTSTPTVLVGPTGGRLRPVTLTSPADATSISVAVDAALT